MRPLRLLPLLAMLLLMSPTAFSAIVGDGYALSHDEYDVMTKAGDMVERTLTVQNKKPSVMTVSFMVTGNISQFIELSTDGISISPEESEEVGIAFFTDLKKLVKEVPLDDNTPSMYYEGTLELGSDITESIPLRMNMDLTDEEVGILLLSLNLLDETIHLGDKLKLTLDLTNLLSTLSYNVTLSYHIMEAGNNTLFSKGERTLSNKTTLVSQDTMTITNSLSVLKEFNITKDYEEGDYIIQIDAHYLSFKSSTASMFNAQYSFLEKRLFGFLPVWVIFMLLVLGLITVVVVFFVRKHLESQKRFHAKIDYKLLPQPGERSLFVGQIAETTHDSYMDMDVLTVHTIVAGSTGGGKSISSQVIVEECLLKNCAIVVFDPTAQWSGMLRKCEDKKMMSFYPRFHLKPSDAQGFPGNIRAIKNGRELIDITKYVKEGEIQVFTTSTLDPKDYDTFVANTVREIFHSNLQEYRGLRTMLVYDEIHRILPKFGGSGEGFVQIERACREFRKWGYGVLLISQVLADFVGQIKANINTEVQMKTRDEGDLNRIKMKYGEEFIHGLVKAPVGSGMVQNSAWNRGLPYYVTFRPIIHSVVRLTDEELEKYNKYNDIVDDLDFQFEQLEQEGQDVFDFRLELKLAKDKIRSGNFNMVQIYLDGLTPRIEKLWGKLGKRPKKLERKLVSLDDMKKEMEAAKASREKADAEKKAEGGVEEKEEEAPKDEPIDPELLKGNLQALKELGGQCGEAVAQKDWNRANELVMEISNTRVDEAHKKQLGGLVVKLKADVEAAKNPPVEKKEGEGGGVAGAAAPAEGAPAEAAPPAEGG